MIELPPLECGKCGRRFDFETDYYIHYDQCKGRRR